MASGITTKLVETIKEFMMEGSTDEEIAELVYSEIDGMESAEEFLEIHGDILTQIRPRLSLDNQRREEAEAQAKQILAKEKEKAQKTEKVKDKRYANVTEVPKETEWTSDEETDLALYFYKDFTDLQIAKKMKRSETDVANKRKALGLNRSKNPKNEKQIKKGQLKYFGLALKKHRESLNGYTIEKIVETFEHVNGGVDVKAYKEWEAGKRYPSLAQFKWLMKRLHITKPASLFESPEVYAEVYPALQKGYKEPEDIPAEIVEEVVNTVKAETKPEEKKEIVFAKGFEEKEPVTVVNASANTPAKIPTPKPSVAVAKPVSVAVAKKVVEEPKTTVVTEKENTMDGNNNGGIKPENIAKLERVAKRTGTTVNAVLNALIEAMKEDVQAEVKVEFKGLF